MDRVVVLGFKETNGAKRHFVIHRVPANVWRLHVDIVWVFHKYNFIPVFYPFYNYNLCPLSVFLIHMDKSETVRKEMIPRVIRKFFFSTITLLTLVMALTLSIIIATLLEKASGSYAAQVLIYNVWWFEALWIWFSLAVFVNLFRFKPWRRGKWDVFLFPFAFSTILLGLIITKHFSVEGYLPLREGESSDKFLSSTSYLKVKAKSGTSITEEEYLVQPSPLEKKWRRKLVSGHTQLSVSINYYIPNPENPKSAEAIEVTIGNGDCTRSFLLPAGKEIEDSPVTIQCDEVEIELGYGPRPLHLPFSLYLENFEVKRYKDSQKPSQFHSDVVIRDTQRDLKKPYSIYMNHILRYRGYRVYQYSFDMDEKGTIFLVRRDPGTPIAYTGFFLLIATISLAFFLPKSRIRELESQIRNLK